MRLEDSTEPCESQIWLIHQFLQIVMAIFDVDVRQAGVVEPALAFGTLVLDFLAVDVKPFDNWRFWGLFNHGIKFLCVRLNNVKFF